MNFDDLRQRAAAVRAVPLETVLLSRGAVRDRRDRRKWHTEQGSLSVSGPKFMNWQRGQCGGGAIDLVMHLAGVDFRTAVAWLQQHAGKAQRPVGAELRGTGPRVWRGMASGTRKDLGYFWIGNPGSQEIVLCESAIDAISSFQMHPQRICISTSGVRADPPWLSGLLARGYKLLCGFDTDDPGDTAAARMMALHPAVRRLRPPAHDWNDALISSR